MNRTNGQFGMNESSMIMDRLEARSDGYKRGTAVGNRGRRRSYDVRCRNFSKSDNHRDRVVVHKRKIARSGSRRKFGSGSKRKFGGQYVVRNKRYRSMDGMNMNHTNHCHGHDRWQYENVVTRPIVIPKSPSNAKSSKESNVACKDGLELPRSSRDPGGLSHTFDDPVAHDPSAIQRIPTPNYNFYNKHHSDVDPSIVAWKSPSQTCLGKSVLSCATSLSEPLKVELPEDLTRTYRSGSQTRSSTTTSNSVHSVTCSKNFSQNGTESSSQQRRSSHFPNDLVVCQSPEYSRGSAKGSAYNPAFPANSPTYSPKSASYDGNTSWRYSVNKLASNDNALCLSPAYDPKDPSESYFAEEGKTESNLDGMEYDTTNPECFPKSDLA